MKCPTCKAELKKYTMHETAVDFCLDCGGYWLDIGELQNVFSKDDLDMRWMETDLWKDPKQSRMIPDGRICPHCRVALHTFEYGDSGIKVDVCRVCEGLWLDKGEVGGLLQYFKDKGQYEILHHYGEVLAEEAWEMFSGPKGQKEELADFLAVLKLLRYKFLAQWNAFSRSLMNIPK